MYNTVKYQAKSSVLCGYFCLFFILLVQNKLPFYDILYRYLHINDLIRNENTIINYFIDGKVNPLFGKKGNIAL